MLLEWLRKLFQVKKPIEKPEWLVDGFVYQPRIVGENNEVIILPNRRDIYSSCQSLEFWVNEKKLKEQPIEKRLMAIWDFVINYITYTYDKNENWQFPAETISRKTGDCEDGTVLFVTLCKIADIPANKVFNACGWFDVGNQKFGHSFPIADIDGIWYVFETTLNKTPKEPLIMKTSSYHADWGLCNWNYYGVIKDGEKNKFQI